MLRIPVPLIFLFALLAVGCSQPAATPQGPAQGGPSACGVERWAVKTLTDPAASQVDLAPTPVTVEQLAALPVPDGFGANAPRLGPEFRAYTVRATLVEFKEETDSDIHLVLQGESEAAMIAEIPDSECALGSRVQTQIAQARARFVDTFGNPTTSWHRVDASVTVTGILFFDVLHGQTGAAPNGIELHPIIDIGP